MSRLMIRELADSCAELLRKEIEPVVGADAAREVGARLPSVFKKVLHRDYAGEEVRIYSAKKSVDSRRERDAAIRAAYNGHNVKSLATQFGLSPRMVFNIVSLGRK